MSAAIQTQRVGSSAGSSSAAQLNGTSLPLASEASSRAALAGVAIRRVIWHTLNRVARHLAIPVGVVSRRYGCADRHVTGYVAAATRREMASVCASAYLGMRYRCYGHLRYRHRHGCR